jgi:hypothetical protein
MSHKTDWREQIPALDNVYMFQGALYCEDCGQNIQNKIRKENRTPEDEDDETSFDSDDFPKGPFSNGGGEADNPQHCDSQKACLNAIELPCGSKIGAWLGNPLTNDGINYLTNSILEDSLTRKNSQHSLQVARLWSYLYRNQLSEWDSLQELEDQTLGAPIVKSFVQLVLNGHNHLLNRVMIGLDNIYGFSSKKSTMWAWKSEFQPDGTLGEPATVQMPLSEAGEREPINIMLELIEEDAWG